MRIGIIGCAGRMGKALIKEVLSNSDGAELAAGLESKGSKFIGKDLGSISGLDPIGITVSDDVNAVIAESDTLINFTAPDITMKLATMISEQGKAHVIGTTGLTDEQRSELKVIADNSVIMHAHNMSVGINLLLGIVEKTASVLPANTYDIEVVEMHHKHKIDAPSGTAISLGEAAAIGRNVNINDVACHSRDGQVGPRKDGEIGFSTIRGGGVVGDHTVIFASENERIELTHKAQSREVFASGAVMAALWTANQANGLYNMQDVLGL